MKEVWTGFALVHSLQQRPDGTTALVTVRPTRAAVNFHIFCFYKSNRYKVDNKLNFVNADGIWAQRRYTQLQIQFDTLITLLFRILRVNWCNRKRRTSKYRCCKIGFLLHLRMLPCAKSQGSLFRIRFNADPYPAVNLNADPDPNPDQGAKPMRTQILVRLCRHKKGKSWTCQF